MVHDHILYMKNERKIEMKTIFDSKPDRPFLGFNVQHTYLEGGAKAALLGDRVNRHFSPWGTERYHRLYI